LPYALIPEGFKLQKVTKMQQEAISAKRSHDDAVALLSNPNTPLVIGGAGLIGVTAYYGDALADFIIEKLKAAGEVFTTTGEEIIRTNIKGWAADFIRAKFAVSGALLTQTLKGLVPE